MTNDGMTNQLGLFMVSRSRAPTSTILTILTTLRPPHLDHLDHLAPPQGVVEMGAGLSLPPLGDDCRQAPNICHLDHLDHLAPPQGVVKMGARLSPQHLGHCCRRVPNICHLAHLDHLARRSGGAGHTGYVSTYAVCHRAGTGTAFARADICPISASICI